ncbi:unnamed protein product [Lymnaea stagnalis]|uniref:C1q domain-containing protein n=1 Tax=Lymnaea stagnalis TaxID=6523 RepID=A0AAV2HUB0_LYMST
MDASVKVTKTPVSNDPVLYDLRVRLETVEGKLSSLEKLMHNKDKIMRSRMKKTGTKIVRHGLRKTEASILRSRLKNTQAKIMGSRLKKTEVKQLLIEEMQLRNDEVDKQVITDLYKLRLDFEKLVKQQLTYVQHFEDLKKKMAALERLRDALNQVNKNVSSRRDLSEKLRELEGDLTRVKSAVAKLDSTATKQGTKQLTRGMPAFVAEVADKTIASVGNVIRFSRVAYNKEDCFSAETSTFRAPTPGLYFFSVSLNINSKGLLAAAISHNGKTVALCGTPNGIDFQASTSVLLELSAEDKVWVETYNMTSEDGVEVGPGFSNFLGVQLR